MPITNPAYLKYPTQRLLSWAFNIFPHQVVATAEIINAPDTVQYPLADFTITSAVDWADVQEDMYVEITRAGALIYQGSIRLAPAGVSDRLYVAGMMFADGGRAFEVQRGIATGDDVTVYSVRVPFAYWSRIDENTEEIYKKWDREVFYNGTAISQTEFPLPVANLGPWQRGAVDAITGVATLTHDASGSQVWRGSGFTVEWILPTGAALAAGYTLTDEVVEVEYDPGIYLIGCTVTEVGGSTPERARTAWRYVWAVDNETVFDTSETVAVEVLSDDASREDGRTLRIRVSGSDLDDLLYTGAPCLMTYRYQFSNDGGVTWVSVPESDGVFVGYLSEWTTVRSDGDITSVEAEVENPLRVSRRLGLYEQLLRTRAAGNIWVNTIATLCRAEYFAYYLIDHHAPWLTTMHDFDATALADFRTRAFATDRGSLPEALQRAASYCLGATFACTSAGTLLAKRDPRIESDAYNAALDERWTIDADHVDEALVYARSPFSRTPDARGDFLVSTNARPFEAYIGRTNAGAPAQGVQEENAGFYIAASLTDGLNRIGHWRAMRNSPTETVEVRLSGMQDVIDPAQQALYRLDLASVDALNTGALDDQLFIAQSVRRSWDTGDTGETVVRVAATFAPLTRGVPGRADLQPGIDSEVGGLEYAVGPIFITPETGWDIYTAGAGAYEPVYDWGWEFDFADGALGFTGDFVEVAEGLQSDLFINTSSIKRRYVDARLSTGAGSIEDVQYYALDYTATRGDNDQPVNLRTRINNTAPPIATEEPQEPGGTLVLEAPDGSDGDGVQLVCVIGDNTFIGAPDPGGVITLTKLTTYGVNVKPTGWTLGSSITPPAGGFWTAGEITQPNGNKRRIIDVQADFPAPWSTVVRLDISFDLTIGTVVNPAAACIQLFHTRSNGTQAEIASVSFADAIGTYEGTGVVFTWTGRIVLKGLRIRIASCQVAAGDPVDGSVVLNPTISRTVVV